MACWRRSSTWCAGDRTYAAKLLTEAFGAERADELLAQVREFESALPVTWRCCRRWSQHS